MYTRVARLLVRREDLVPGHGGERGAAVDRQVVRVLGEALLDDGGLERVRLRLVGDCHFDAFYRGPRDFSLLAWRLHVLP